MGTPLYGVRAGSLGWEKCFRAFHRAKMSTQDTKRENTWHDTWEIVTPKPSSLSGLHIKCKINHVCGHSTRYCRANTGKMATRVILVTFIGNSLRIYPNNLSKTGTPHSTTPGKFRTKDFVTILVCYHFLKTLPVTIIKTSMNIIRLKSHAFLEMQRLFV